MDEFGKFGAAIVLVVGVMFIVMVGIMAVVIIGAAIGVGWVIFLIVKRVRADMEAARQEEERKRLETQKQQKLLLEKICKEEERTLLAAAKEQDELAAKLKAQADRRERERILREIEADRQERERKREEQEQARQAQEEAARQRLEAEQQKVAQSLATWNDGVVKCPTPAEADGIIGQASTMHSHTGRFLHAIALIGPSGVIVQWQAHTAESVTPQVICRCDNDIMFSGWACKGQYSTLLSPGRYALTFVVNQPGRPGGETDLSFAIVIPDGKAAPSAKEFAKAVNTTATNFVQRAKTVAKAKQKVAETLAAQGTDPDEIGREMGKLEVQLKELNGDG